MCLLLWVCTTVLSFIVVVEYNTFLMNKRGRAAFSLLSIELSEFYILTIVDRPYRWSWTTLHIVKLQHVILCWRRNALEMDVSIRQRSQTHRLSSEILVLDQTKAQPNPQNLNPIEKDQKRCFWGSDLHNKTFEIKKSNVIFVRYMQDMKHSWNSSSLRPTVQQRNK